MSTDELAELAALVDRLRWDRRRHPYTGRRAYAQTAAEVVDRCARLLAEGQGRRDEARKPWETALRIYEEIGSRSAAAVRDRLALLKLE